MNETPTPFSDLFCSYGVGHISFVRDEVSCSLWPEMPQPPTITTSGSSTVTTTLGGSSTTTRNATSVQQAPQFSSALLVKHCVMWTVVSVAIGTHT